MKNVDYARLEQQAHAARICHEAGLDGAAVLCLLGIKKTLGDLEPKVLINQAYGIAAQDPVMGPPRDGSTHTGVAGPKPHPVRSRVVVKDAIIKHLKEHGASTANEIADENPDVWAPSVTGSLTKMRRDGDVVCVGSKTTQRGLQKSTANVYDLPGGDGDA